MRHNAGHSNVYAIHVFAFKDNKGPFNNYVDKNRGRGSAKSPRLSTQGPRGEVP